MGTNPLLGILFHSIGGFTSATNFVPLRAIKRWSWEIYWLVQSFAACVLVPLLFTISLIPHLSTVLTSAYAQNPAGVRNAFLLGILWGIGTLTFGLSIRYLGIALGYTLFLGVWTILGALIPPLTAGLLHPLFHTASGRVILGGVLLCLLALVLHTAAGRAKDREFTAEDRAEAGEPEYSFGKGFGLVVLAAVMNSFFAAGLIAGRSIGNVARGELATAGRSALWQNLPALLVVLLGGFLTNLVWCAILIVKNRSAAQYLGQPGLNPMRVSATRGDTLVDFDPLDRSTYDRVAPPTLVRNYLLAAIAGLLWYLQFPFLSLGAVNLGRYGFASWGLRMASVILFASLWGVLLKEWRGTTARTRMLVALGVVLLVSSTGVIAYGNYLRATHRPAHQVG